MFFFFDTGGSRLRLRLDEPPPAIGHRPSGLKVPLANGSQILTQPLARLNDHLSTLIFNRAIYFILYFHIGLDFINNGISF